MWKSGFGFKAITFAVAMGAVIATFPAAAQPTETRIDTALQNITNITRQDRVGYATIWDGNKFVQCRRLEDRTLRCEAAGRTMQPSLGNILTGDRLNRIASLGWVLDPGFGNHVRLFPADMPSSRIAAQILNVLKDGYGTNTEEVQVSTRWMIDVPCPPRAGLSQNLAGSVNDAPEMRRVVIHTCAFVPDLEPAQTAASAEELITIYGSTATAEIQRLRINAANNVFAIFNAGIGYVQCRPDAINKIMYCEAQSAESWPALSAILTPERVTWLHNTGFADPGRAPNYWKTYELEKYGDAAIAREILNVLYTVYGYTGKTKLKVATD